MTCKPGSDAWLDQVREPIIDPERPIIDPHHHLWERPDSTYVLQDLWADTDSGHNIVKTVFLECGESYREDGPEHLKSVGETEFVEAIASASRERGGATIAGIVAHADLRSSHLDDVLDAHEAAGKGLFRGIRHYPPPEELSMPGPVADGLYQDNDFRKGLARLGERGYTFDAWHFHHQNRAFRDVAATVPRTTMILDHFGTPLGSGSYEGKREEIFAVWREDISAIAECTNVIAKLGGLAMPFNGFGWDRRETPPTSDEFVEVQRRYYDHTIQCFGPERCMFESNFPVDRRSLSYHVLWNGLKKIAFHYSEAEQASMFYGTAARIYRLE
jgi:predicted TIM-barrel fold metal-dependent hydrolase